MTKFHVNDMNGVNVCTASVKTCKYQTGDNHFDNEVDAIKYAEARNVDAYGLFSYVEKADGKSVDSSNVRFKTYRESTKILEELKKNPEDAEAYDILKAITGDSVKNMMRDDRIDGFLFHMGGNKDPKVANAARSLLRLLRN